MPNFLNLIKEKSIAIVNSCIDYILEKIGAEKIHCLGDSHLKSFRYLYQRRYLYKTVFDFCIVRGATASGVLNPGSKTQGFSIFKRYMKDRIQKKDWILICLGEVDCGYVVWYRCQKYNTNKEDELAKTVNNYIGFLNYIISKGFQKVIVYNAPLPTIKDGQNWGEIAHLRKEVKSPLKERTLLTLKFNAQLRSFCTENNIAFIDLERDILDTDKMIIKKKFLHPNPLDHHLNPKATGPIIAQKLKELGFS